MIRLENVTKSYPTPKGQKYILRDVSIEFPPKCNIAILGRNGMGKSTLLRLLGGIDFPNRGYIRSEERISWPMGLSGGVQGSMSGRDNARFVCRIYGDSEHEVERKIEYIYEFTELGDYFDMPVKTYSSGMKARLSFATSMAFDFDIYLMDEITAVGDQRFKEKSRAALQEKKDKANIIKVSHNMQELIRDCDVGIYLEKGQMHLYEDIKEAVAIYQREQAA
ncbi:MAG: ABC transporter ATP-binding protein [Gammaproteobacteria bacterium (ex Lamellibrachia satsuma)]|nr:MAG: ABC transporter ATP-binding protein [Gammaproteobacteria bacterium (ex Lamellibrachia satsuma)]RRS33630.1 MAG: ABC transporter ATP-binding protein [Gammaproteobacteria bacterium (ex Lamellibrachia satsuma)]RRS34803.1 MAG: ABC transporter ATP-binding protein [Gammaproteobacteria bacterium (ex Lamellibrachia satsuma)]